MGVSQDFVDLADVTGSDRRWIEARETAAGRTTAPERRDALGTTGGGRMPPGLARLPAGEAFCLSRQVVERGGQCGEAEAKAGGVDRVVGRGRRRERKRLDNAREQDAWGSVRGDIAAAAALRQAQETPGRIEERKAWDAQLQFAPSTAVDLRSPSSPKGLRWTGRATANRSAGDITTAMPKRRSCGSMVAGFGLRSREGNRATTRPRAAAMISRRAAASAGRSSRRMARWRRRGRVGRPPAMPPSPQARKTGRLAMTITPARMRFNASRFRSIA